MSFGSDNTHAASCNIHVYTCIRGWKYSLKGFQLIFNIRTFSEAEPFPNALLSINDVSIPVLKVFVYIHLNSLLFCLSGHNPICLWLFHEKIISMCFVQIYNLYSLESRKPICYIWICLFLSIFVLVSLLNADSDCVQTSFGRFNIILKYSCRKFSSKHVSLPYKTQVQILELRSRSPNSVVNDSKNYNSLLFSIAKTHPTYTTGGQYNIYYKKYEGDTMHANHVDAKYLIHINKGEAYIRVLKKNIIFFDKIPTSIKK